MIFIGLDDNQKRIEVERYQASHDIHKVVVISADEFPLPIADTDQVTYSDVIMYVTFYRLLQEINSHTLIVINECLRTQNRYDLSYNCIRNYLNQTPHQLIFQQLPLIDTAEDFMILFDFDTRSRWKRQPFDSALIKANAEVVVSPLPVTFKQISVPTSAPTKQKYQAEKAKLFAALGAKDPHTLPRNLYLIGGKDKQAFINAQAQPDLFNLSAPSANYVARNQRLGGNVVTFDQAKAEDAPYTIVELPHRFIDFSDFIKRTGQASHSVLVADLKVDAWYFSRYQAWGELGGQG